MMGNSVHHMLASLRQTSSTPRLALAMALPFLLAFLLSSMNSNSSSPPFLLVNFILLALFLNSNSSSPCPKMPTSPHHQFSPHFIPISSAPSLGPESGTNSQLPHHFLPFATILDSPPTMQIMETAAPPHSSHQMVPKQPLHLTQPLPSPQDALSLPPTQSHQQMSQRAAPTSTGQLARQSDTKDDVSLVLRRDSFQDNSASMIVMDALPIDTLSDDDVNKVFADFIAKKFARMKKESLETCRK